MNYPENEELSFYDMNDKASHYGKEGTDYKIYYTKRGINVGSPAKINLEAYDLSRFNISYSEAFLWWPTIKDEYTLNKIEKYKEKYKSNNEQVKHTNELDENVSLFVNAASEVDKNGNFNLLELNEKGNPIERNYNNDFYHIYFKIRKDNIYSWAVEHELSMEDYRYRGR